MTMTRKEVASLGGKAMADRLKSEAIAAYNANPTLCKQCNNPIPLDGKKASLARKKEFCCRSCASVYNNARFPRKRGPNPLPLNRELLRVCKTCGGTFNLQRRKNGRFNYAKTTCGCNSESTIGGLTKAELFNKRKNYQSARSSIRRHAQSVFLASTDCPACHICGYSKHVEVCHIISVSEFPPEALIADINSPSNLVGLCPTHHWEFDEGILKL